MSMFGEPPERVIELLVFEDNVKKGYARIKKHIAETEARLNEKGAALRHAGTPISAFREFTEEDAFCRGMNRALQHLIDAMGTEEAFEDEYWREHCSEDH